jgi:osmotically-inducible protein OsmY
MTAMSRTATFAAGCIVGAAAEYLLDPTAGKRRRHLTRDKALSRVRHRSQDAVRRAKYMEGVAEGVAHRAAQTVHHAHHEPPDDVTLSRKVESIAFRQAGTPKGHVSVNSEDGVVFLRGQLDTFEQIDALVSATGAVDGVKEVKNLLHTRS